MYCYTAGERYKCLLSVFNRQQALVLVYLLQIAGSHLNARLQRLTEHVAQVGGPRLRKERFLHPLVVHHGHHSGGPLAQRLGAAKQGKRLHLQRLNLIHVGGHGSLYLLFVEHASGTDAAGYDVQVGIGGLFMMMSLSSLLAGMQFPSNLFCSLGQLLSE